VFHDGLREEGDVLDIADTGHGARTPGGAMHAAGVEFNYAFLIGQTTVPDARVLGIVLGTTDHFHDCIQGVTAFLQHVISALEIIEAVGSTDHDRFLTGPGFNFVFLRQDIGSESVYGKGSRSDSGSGNKIST